MRLAFEENVSRKREAELIKSEEMRTIGKNEALYTSLANYSNKEMRILS